MAQKQTGTWTKEDEANFEALRKRREEVVGAQDERLRKIAEDLWVAIINRSPDAIAQADRGRCIAAVIESLRLYPYDLRAALEPFDNGPPPVVETAPPV